MGSDISGHREVIVKRHSIAGGLVAGAFAGGIATWVMDLVTTGFMASQSKADAAAEKAGQANGRSSVDNLLTLIEERTGVHVDDDLRPTVLQALHYALGIGPGAVYGALRGRVPMIGAARGLAFGALVFAANDEYLNAALGLAGPPDAYPVSTHLRGLVGHLALGATLDTLLDII
jgi:hypothetical protein